MRPSEVLPALYQSDETAWLEKMAQLIREQRLDELDYPHLCEFLDDMARRDKREVESGLALLIAHRLKWSFQPERRCGSWRATIEVQRQELTTLLESGALRNHALAILPKAYAAGVRQAVAETELPPETFPEDCPYDLDLLLSKDASERSI
jgi:hypothetical protein